MARILVIDDDADIRKFLSECLADSGHMLMVADTLSEGRQLGEIGKFDLVFLDVNLPDGNGLDAISELKGTVSMPEVIVITAEGDEQGAQMAFEYGALDYLLKPFTHHEVKLVLKRTLEFRESKTALRSSSEFFFDRSAIIGSSPPIMACLHAAGQCAQGVASVLITGQTGTGKELMANVIHENSSRKKGGLVTVDCAALPEQLVESVLFGNIKGAFTGADASRDGLVKNADGGTLFLDEIGELPLSIQKKFLRVLQEKKFKPVGGTKDIHSDFRLISATNKDLECMVEKKEFRSDLLFRIKTVHIQLPPLKDCKKDIKDFTLHYIHHLCNRYGYETKGFTPEFLNMLESYDWPGNIRELINSLEKAVLSGAESTTLYPNFLPNQIRLKYVRPSIKKQQQAGQMKDDRPVSKRSIVLPDRLFNPITSLKQVKEYSAGETEKIYLNELLALSDNDLAQASRLSCLSKSHLYSLLKKYHISRTD